MDKKNSVIAIVTKPLQLLVAWNCICQISSPDAAVLIIVDHFDGAKTVHKNISRLCIFKKVVYVRNRFQAFFRASLFLGSQVILIDSDVGRELGAYVRIYHNIHRNTRMMVYEEGIGSYHIDAASEFVRRTANKRPSVLVKNIRKFINLFLHPLNVVWWILTCGRHGWSRYFGGSPEVYGIFLFNPELYPHNKITIKIKNSISDFIVCNEYLLWKIFGCKFELPHAGGECIVYMSSWKVNQGLIDQISSDDTVVGFFKPHPHIKEAPIIPDNIIYIPGMIPFELLVCRLSSIYSRVTVYHHGSSSVRYVCIENVRFVDFGAA